MTSRMSARKSVYDDEHQFFETPVMPGGGTPQQFGFDGEDEWGFDDMDNGGKASFLSSSDFGGMSSMCAGDPYAFEDDVTRGADPVSLMAPGVEPPFWAGFGGFPDSSAGLFPVDKQRPGKVEYAPPLEPESFLAVNHHHEGKTGNFVQNEGTPALAVSSFGEETEPPAPPASSLFVLRGTTVYAAATSGAEVGNRLLDFFRQEVGAVQDASSGASCGLLKLKSTPAKFTLKATVVTQGLRELTVKVRMYSLRVAQEEDDDAEDVSTASLAPCVACEFQRQAGDGPEFVELYQQAKAFLNQTFAAAYSRQELRHLLLTSAAGSSAVDGCSTSPLLPPAQGSLSWVDTSAAQEAITLAVLPQSLEEELAGKKRNAVTASEAVESLVCQLVASCSGLCPELAEEAAAGIALLARKANDKDLAEALLSRLMTQQEEDPCSGCWSPLLALLTAQVESKVGSYAVACLLESLFRFPRCTLLLCQSEEAVRTFEEISRPLLLEGTHGDDQIPEATLVVMSKVVCEICTALDRAGVQGQLARELRDRVRRCADSPSCRRSGAVRENLTEAMISIPLVKCC